MSVCPSVRLRHPTGTGYQTSTKFIKIYETDRQIALFDFTLAFFAIIYDRQQILPTARIFNAPLNMIPSEHRVI